MKKSEQLESNGSPVNAIVSFIKKVLPTALTVGSMIYNYVMRKVSHLKKEKLHEETKRKWVENERDVEIEHTFRTDVDVVNDAISEGREFIKDRSKGNGSK